jgi:hypothetical protein
VMSYAHLGSPRSVQTYRDQYFHVGSINQILARLPKCNVLPLPCGCVDTAAPATKPPAITASPRLLTLRGTAFRLNAGVSLTGDYRARWEEIDQGLKVDSIPPFYRSHASSAPNRTFPAWDKLWSGRFREGDLLFDKCTTTTREKCRIRFQLTARADDRRVAAMHATTVEVADVGPFRARAIPVVGAVNVEWEIRGAVDGQQLPPDLYPDVAVKIGTGPEDRDWYLAGTAHIAAKQFIIHKPPFPSGTRLRVLVEAVDGSYLALSGSFRLN